MSFLKWLLGLLVGLVKLLFQDSFRSLLKQNLGQGIEVNLSGIWRKSVVLKVGSDYVVLLMEKKEYFVPISTIQGIKLIEI